MLLAYQSVILYIYHVPKHIETSLMLIWFPVLLACGESADESVGIGPYWLEKIPTSIRSPLLRWLASLDLVCPRSCPCLIYPRVVLEKDSSSAESIYGRLDETVRVPVRAPMPLLAHSQPYHGDHKEGSAFAHSYCYYCCLIRPLCGVYAFFSV